MEFVMEGTEVAVGHCVIVNACDRPCSELLAVITEVGPDRVFCKYLNADPRFDKYNAGRGMQISLGSLTPVAKFGVDVIVKFTADLVVYRCVVVAESVATYSGGQSRRWQELMVYNRQPRLSLLPPEWLKTFQEARP